MGSRRPRMPGFGDDGGGGRGGGQAGRGARPGRGGFYPQQPYQQGGGRGDSPYPKHYGQAAAYQPRAAMPAQQWRPAGPPAPTCSHNNGAVGNGASALIAPELRQAMNGDHAPHEPAAADDVPASPDGSPPPAVLEAVAEHLAALSMDGAVVVVQPPIPLPGDACKFPHRPGSGRTGTRSPNDVHPNDVHPNDVPDDCVAEVESRSIYRNLNPLHVRV